MAKPLAVVDGHLSTVTICLLRLVLGDGAAHVATLCEGGGNWERSLVVPVPVAYFALLGCSI